MATTYEPAPAEVHETLKQVLKAHFRFEPLLDAGLRFDILFAWNEKKPPLKRKALATIQAVGAEERCHSLHGEVPPDVRIKIDAKRYKARTHRMRAGILAHELYHLELESKDGRLVRDDYDRPKFTLIDDDWEITGFREVAEWYGEDSAEVMSLKSISELLSQGTFQFMKASDKPATPADGPDEIDRRPIRGELNDALTAGVEAAEERKAGRIGRESLNVTVKVKPHVKTLMLEAETSLLAIGHNPKEIADGLALVENPERFKTPAALVGEFYRITKFDRGHSVELPDKEASPEPGEFGPAAVPEPHPSLRPENWHENARPKAKRGRKKAEPAAAPVDDGMGRFLITRVGSRKGPLYAIKAPSLLAANYYIKSLDFPAKAEPDFEDSPTPGVPLAYAVDKTGKVVTTIAMPTAVPAKAYERPAAKTKRREKAHA